MSCTTSAMISAISVSSGWDRRYRHAKNPASLGCVPRTNNSGFEMQRRSACAAHLYCYRCSTFSASQILIRDWYGTSRRFASLQQGPRQPQRDRLGGGFEIGEAHALPQGPAYSEESWVSQNSRSSASEAKSGIGISFLLIASPFLSMHVAGGNCPDFSTIETQCESQVGIAHRLRRDAEHGRAIPTLFAELGFLQRGAGSPPQSSALPP